MYWCVVVPPSFRRSLSRDGGGGAGAEQAQKQYSNMRVFIPASKTGAKSVHT